MPITIHLFHTTMTGGKRILPLSQFPTTKTQKLTFNNFKFFKRDRL